MKKITIGMVVFSALLLFTKDSMAKATVTLGANQYEISRIRVNGVWQDACCKDLPANNGCEDDCPAQSNGGGSTHNPLPFENYPNFANNPPNINLGGGNSGWIIGSI